MTKIERSIIIEKPLEEVFQYASDWQKWPDWFEGVSDFKPTTESAKGNGTRYRYQVKMMGLKLNLETEIYDYETNRGWCGKSLKGMPHRTSWFFEAANRGTRFTYGLEYTLPIPLLGDVIDQYIMQPQWIKIIEKSLQNLNHKLQES
jgi:uncharacterized membrane protein